MKSSSAPPADGVHLIISVDTGIRAFAAAEDRARTGVDLIVTDHHLPGNDGLPYALAVVNPNQDGCDYPCKHLCGAGVAFKLAQGLMQAVFDPRDQITPADVVHESSSDRHHSRRRSAAG